MMWRAWFVVCFALGIALLLAIAWSISPRAAGELGGALILMCASTRFFRATLASVKVGPLGAGVFGGILAWLLSLAITSAIDVLPLANAAVEYGVGAAMWVVWDLAKPKT